MFVRKFHFKDAKSLREAPIRYALNPLFVFPRCVSSHLLALSRLSLVIWPVFRVGDRSFARSTDGARICSQPQSVHRQVPPRPARAGIMTSRLPCADVLAAVARSRACLSPLTVGTKRSHPATPVPWRQVAAQRTLCVSPSTFASGTWSAYPSQRREIGAAHFWVVAYLNRCVFGSAGSCDGVWPSPRVA